MVLVVVSIEGIFFFFSPSVSRGRITECNKRVCAFSKTVTHVDFGVSFFLKSPLIDRSISFLKKKKKHLQ